MFCHACPSSGGNTFSNSILHGLTFNPGLISTGGYLRGLECANSFSTRPVSSCMWPCACPLLSLNCEEWNWSDGFIIIVSISVWLCVPWPVMVTLHQCIEEYWNVAFISVSRLKRLISIYCSRKGLANYCCPMAFLLSHSLFPFVLMAWFLSFSSHYSGCLFPYALCQCAGLPSPGTVFIPCYWWPPLFGCSWPVHYLPQKDNVFVSWIKILEKIFGYWIAFWPSQAHSMPVKYANALLVLTFLLYISKGLHFFVGESLIGVAGRSKPWMDDSEHSAGLWP